MIHRRHCDAISVGIRGCRRAPPSLSSIHDDDDAECGLVVADRLSGRLYAYSIVSKMMKRPLRFRWTAFRVFESGSGNGWRPN
jgi:hypothetical protein